MNPQLTIAEKLMNVSNYISLNENDKVMLNNILSLCFGNIELAFKNNDANKISLYEALTFIKSNIKDERLILKTLNAFNNELENTNVLAYNLVTKRYYICHIKNNTFINCFDIDANNMKVNFYVHNFMPDTIASMCIICNISNEQYNRYCAYNAVNIVKNNQFIKIINPKQNKEIYAIVKTIVATNDNITMKFLYMFMNNNVFLHADYTVQPEDYFMVDISEDYVPDIVLSTIASKNIVLSDKMKYVGTKAVPRDFENKLVSIYTIDGIVIGELKIYGDKKVISSPILYSQRTKNTILVDDYDLTNKHDYMYDIPNDELVNLYIKFVKPNNMSNENNANKSNESYINVENEIYIKLDSSNMTYRVKKVENNRVILSNFLSDVISVKNKNKFTKVTENDIKKMLIRYFTYKYFNLPENAFTYKADKDALYITIENTYIQVYEQGEWFIENKVDYELKTISLPTSFKFVKKDDKIYFTCKNMFISQSDGELKITFDEKDTKTLIIKYLRSYKEPIKEFDINMIYAIRDKETKSMHCIIPINRNEGYVIKKYEKHMNIEKININDIQIFHQIHI